MLNEEQRCFVDTRRVARLATADATGRPHVIPVCFARNDDTLYIAVDQKPKRRPGAPLQRERNLLENPQAALIVDHYEDDWQQLGWVLLRGVAELLRAAAADARCEHESVPRLVAALVARDGTFLMPPHHHTTFLI